MIRRLLIVICVLVLLAAAGAAALIFVVPPPSPSIDLTFPQQITLDGSLPQSIPVPQGGSFALATSLEGQILSKDGDTPHPIASIAKTMSALAILTAHPLQPGQDGPSITVTAADSALVGQVEAEGGSVAPVAAGETLSERDLLLGMMLPSANNFAIMAANWVDGSVPAFVTRLNRMATTMGMTETYFDDPDGLSDKTVSSANDLLKLGQAAVANSTLISITQLSKATLPAGTGVIQNIDAPLLAHPGWLGIKTGHTNAAGYCLLFAARDIQTSGVTAPVVTGVVMGQPTRQATFNAAFAATETALSDYVVVDPAVVTPSVAGSVRSAWGTSTGVRATTSQEPFVVRRGMTVAVRSTTLHTDKWATAGTEIGTLTATVFGHNAIWDVVTVSPLGEPTPLQRLSLRV